MCRTIDITNGLRCLIDLISLPGINTAYKSKNYMGEFTSDIVQYNCVYVV